MSVQREIRRRLRRDQSELRFEPCLPCLAQKGGRITQHSGVNQLSEHGERSSCRRGANLKSRGLDK